MALFWQRPKCFEPHFCHILNTKYSNNAASQETTMSIMNSYLALNSFQKLQPKRKMVLAASELFTRLPKHFHSTIFWLSINVIFFEKKSIQTSNEKLKIQVTPTIFLEKIVIHTNKYVCFFPLRLRCSNKPIFLVKQIHSLYPCLLMQHKT